MIKEPKKKRAINLAGYFLGRSKPQHVALWIYRIYSKDKANKTYQRKQNARTIYMTNKFR